MAQLLPLKLLALFLKQLTKPISNSIKDYAREPGPFRHICQQIGQNYHLFRSKISLRSIGQSEKIKNIKTLDDDAAVAVGANISSEVFLFTSASSLIYWEIHRKNRLDDEIKAEKQIVLEKEKKENQIRMENIEKRLEEIEDKLHIQRKLSPGDSLNSSTSIPPSASPSTFPNP